MIDDLVHVGFPISSKGEHAERYLDGFAELAENGLLGWLQIYVNPGTTYQDLQKFKDLGVQLAIHAAHQGNGFNPEDGLTDVNKQIIEEASMAAETLASPMIVYHPGFHTKNPYGLGGPELMEQHEKSNSVYLKMAGDVPPESKVVIENMPRWVHKKLGVFIWENDALFQEESAQNFGVCADVANILQNANWYPQYIHDPPEMEVRCCIVDAFDIQAGVQDFYGGYRHQIHFDVLSKFLRRGPDMIHIRGLGYKDLTRNPQEFQDENLEQLNVIMPYVRETQTPLILEVPLGHDFHRNYLEHVMMHT